MSYVIILSPPFFFFFNIVVYFSCNVFLYGSGMCLYIGLLVQSVNLFPRFYVYTQKKPNSNISLGILHDHFLHGNFLHDNFFKW